MTKGTSNAADRRIATLRAGAQECTRCDLYASATQAVFGEGPADPDIVLLGEQPGDQEDRAGRPFVGPAGKVLDRALADAGIDRVRTYVTNAVKHFKFRQQGKVRVHQTPNAAEVAACTAWWESELEVLDPPVVVCLGATAGKAVFGSRFRVTRDRGEFVPLDGRWATGTIHPSAVLRAGKVQREEYFDGLVHDLTAAARQVTVERPMADVTQVSEPTLFERRAP